MKYYKVAPAFNNANKRVASSASGDKVLKGEEYYNILKDGEFHKEIPLLKHFFLESYDEKKYWDFQLNDIHNLIGKANTIIGYYLSNDFKNILEDFNIAPVFNFYETLLLYKEKELKYWLFQYGVNSFDNFNLPQSIFKIEDEEFIIKTQDEYWIKKREARKVNTSKLLLKKLSINGNYDFFFNQINSDTVVSGNLKKIIEDANLKGFEFVQLDYEVVVSY